MKSIHVLLVWPNRPEQMAMLDDAYHLHRYDLASEEGRVSMLDEFGDQIRAVVTTHGGGLEKSLIDRLPNLEIVACSSVGLDTLCVDECKARGIQVTNTPNVLTDDVADMALLLLLATVRRLVPGIHWVHSGDWVNKGMMPLNTSVHGKTVGVVGLGRIGKAIAHRAQAFGMKVCYYGRRQSPDVDYTYYDTIEALAHDVDILMPAIPGGESTEGLISRPVLKALGPQGYFINIARGSVVDENALVELLCAGQLAGAGLDVFADEPHVPEALLALDNVVLQPHCSSGTYETRGRMAQLVVDNLAAHFAGKALITPV